MSDKSLKFFDKRTFQRNIDSGFISSAEYKSFKDSLVDESENFEEIPFEDPDELPFTAEELGLVESDGDAFSAFGEAIQASSERDPSSELE